MSNYFIYRVLIPTVLMLFALIFGEMGIEDSDVMGEFDEWLLADLSGIYSEPPEIKLIRHIQFQINNDAIKLMDSYNNYPKDEVINMLTNFIEKAETEYYENLKSIWGEWLKQNYLAKKKLNTLLKFIQDYPDKLKEKYMGDDPYVLKEILEERVEKSQMVINQIPGMIKELSKLRNWAKHSLENIENNNLGPPPLIKFYSWS